MPAEYLTWSIPTTLGDIGGPLVQDVAVSGAGKTLAVAWLHSADLGEITPTVLSISWRDREGNWSVPMVVYATGEHLSALGMNIDACGVSHLV